MWWAGHWQDPGQEGCVAGRTLAGPWAGNPWGGAGSAAGSVGRSGASADAQVADLSREADAMLSHQAQDRRAETCDARGACRARGLSSERWDQREQLGVPSPEAEVRPMRTESTGTSAENNRGEHSMGRDVHTGCRLHGAPTSTWVSPARGPHVHAGCRLHEAPTRRPCAQVWDDSETGRTNPSHSESLKSCVPALQGGLAVPVPSPLSSSGPSIRRP